MTDRRRVAACAVALLACAAGPWARAQAGPKRIGYLTVFSRADTEGFLGLIRTELRKLGWDDGRHITLELRSSEGRIDSLAAMAAEMVGQAPELLLAQTLPATRALMQATQTIPIVMVSVGNPVEHGLVADYRRPGGNVTGSVFPADETTRKLLQLLKEAMPRLRSVALLTNPNNEAAAPMAKQLRADAAAMDVQLQVVEVKAKGDFDAAFAAIRLAKTQAIMMPPEPLIVSQRDAIGEFARAQGLPVAAVGRAASLQSGALLAFVPAQSDFAQIAARQVDRILKGAKPAEMPIEQPTHFELRLNQRAARALGVTLPQAMLLRADEVME